MVAAEMLLDLSGEKKPCLKMMDLWPLLRAFQVMYVCFHAIKCFYFYDAFLCNGFKSHYDMTYFKKCQIIELLFKREKI